MNDCNFVRIGAVLGGLAVAAGAFGAHMLEGKVSARQLENFQTGAHYQAIHSLALVGVGLWAGRGGWTLAAKVAGWAFLLGVVVFSGTLYGLGLGGPRWLGAITPIGGVSLLVGWAAFAVAATSRRANDSRSIES